MRHLRWVFLALALALLLAMGLLLDRSLSRFDAESGVQHRAVAERVFDEMERELTALLRREESRPFGHYRFYYVPEGVTRQKIGVARSPLASPPSEPWIVGYFQVDPDGSFHTPRVPRDPALAEGNGDWTRDPGLLAAKRELEALVIRGLRLASAPAAERDAALGQEPGTTLAFAERPASPRAAAPAEESSPPVDTYQALRSLNRGLETRAARQAKRGPEARREERRALGDAAKARAGEPSDEPTAKGRPAGAAASPGKEEREERGAGVAGVYFDAEAVLSARPPAGQAVELHPMIGRAVDDAHLLLYRAAFLDGRGHRQGLVLDVAALTRALESRVLGRGGLAANVGFAFFRSGQEPPSEGARGSFHYLHRFAEPFAALVVRLSLPPLGRVRGIEYVYAFAALLGIAVAIGLWAVYRMVVVRLGFAERRSNFVAAVSHELKTPLTAIRMHAEMLRDGMVGDDAKRGEYYATITAESERLSRLIDNVLEFSRLEQGTREMQLSVGPIAPVVEEAVRVLDPHARRAGFALQVEIEDALPPVRFDRDALLQVVFNLVDNALKYARESGAREITLRCARAEAGVALSVRDHGPGVSPRHLPKIFEAFYRGEDELTRRAKGSGIGLALVKGLAERMGAAVSGRNAAGGGFEVALVFRAESG